MSEGPPGAGQFQKDGLMMWPSIRGLGEKG